MQNSPKAKKVAKTRAKAKPAQVDPVMAKRAKAYFDMEPHLCDVVKMGTIAVGLFDHPDRELYDFAVGRVSEMLDDLKARYYAECFPPEN
jgi:hypothetical protein